MAQLWIIRHGETQWNRENRFQGILDVPLSETGRAQARRLAAYLADKHFDAVYSSPLSRALDTARIVAAEHGLEVETVTDLQEIDVGEWAGKTWADIRRMWPQLEKTWRANPLASDPPPGGEHYAEFRRRCLAALEAIAARHGEEQRVAVISHGGVIRAVLTALLEIPWQTRGRLYSLNCSITKLRWQPGGPVIIDAINEACHLEQATLDRWRDESSK
ncbi:MAG: histidine phosphatase family protein [Firmicutes bacterium]|nr:histidine phosphatase family protein [Bacillota bacterium]HOB35199.1 histidine phosphatase family protein [Bacillota bacterium]HPZ90293.1 histidine phosphatase family protein [Bacillota bacterium]HQE01798.1 histidine phosphatase family protein [Bacillota bacterium]